MMANLAVVGAVVGEDVLPRSSHQRLKAKSLKLTLLAMSRAAEVVRLDKLFEAAGITALALKGVVLSQQLYQNTMMRGAGDIDMLVAPRHFFAAFDLLVREGYVPQGKIDAGLRDVTLIHPDKGHPVELHQRFSVNPHRLDIPFDQLWEERTEVALGGRMVATIPPAILASYLVIHGSDHCWERLAWIADVATLMLRAPGVEGLLEQARPHSLERAMLIPMALAQDWLGVPVPGSLARKNAMRQASARFKRWFYLDGRWLDVMLEGQKQPLRRRLLRRVFLYSLKGGWRYRFSELSADLNDPVHRETFRLPVGLGWLYPLLRPFGRLLWRGGRSGGPRR
jgi:hypothetical protein